MTLNLPPVWTAERVAQLRQLASDGLSASQMGATLGVTRNAVIGKMRRTGIPFTGIPTWQDWRRSHQPNAAQAEPSQRNPRRKVSRVTALRAQFEIAATEATDFSSEPGERITGATAAVLSLTSDSCRWPFGDPRSPDFHFCMKTKLDWFQYCGEHCRKAHQSSVERQRRAA